MRNFKHLLIIFVAAIFTVVFQASIAGATGDVSPHRRPIPSTAGAPPPAQTSGSQSGFHLGITPGQQQNMINGTPNSGGVESGAVGTAAVAASTAAADALGECKEETFNASESCQGFDMTEMMATMAAQQAAGSLSQVGGKAACASQLAITGVQTTYGIMRLTKCNSAYNTCNSKCTAAQEQCRSACQSSGDTAAISTCVMGCQNRFRPSIAKCSSYRSIGMILGGSNIATGLLSGVAAKMCKDQLDAENNKCKGDNAKNNQFCPNYCSFPENKTVNSWCLTAECSDPAKARINPSCGPAYCYQFIGNPNPPAECAYLGGTPLPPVNNDPPPGLTAGPNLPLPPGEDYDLPPDENIPRVEGSGKGTGIGEFAAGSGMGGGGGPGVGAGNNNGQGGSGKGPYDTNIDKGFQGGGSGGYSASGVAVDGSAGAGSRGGAGGGAGEKDNFDLSKFLPGGEQAGAGRNPASADLIAQGITGANDISNFEKISRKMNQKRPLMKNPEGK